MKRSILKSLIILSFIISLGIASARNSLSQTKTDVPVFSLPFKQCWSYITNLTTNNIASDNVKSIIISTLEGKLLALDFYSGEKIWETELGGMIISDVVNDLDKENIYVATKILSSEEEINKKNHLKSSTKKNSRVTIKLTSLGKTTGITNWWIPVATEESKSNHKLSIFVFDNKIIIADQSGGITALNKKNGEIIWKKSLNLYSDNTQIELQDKNFIILSKNRILIDDFQTKKYTFQKESNSTLTNAYLFKNNLYFGNKKGEITAFNIDSQKSLWKFRTGAEVSNISFTPEGLLATSFDNFIYLIAPENGKEIWKRRLEGRIVIKPYLFDKYAIVLTLGSSEATIIDLKEGKPVNRIRLDTDNQFVNRPILKGHLIIFPAVNGIFSFTNSNNRCVAG